MIRAIAEWLKRLHPKKLEDLLAVDFDDCEIRVRVLDELDAEWNQTFRWDNIRRVCFKDEGMWASDMIYISLRNPDLVRVVPTEARSGHAFFGALCDRGYFPEHIWRKAVGDTSGGMHCWPPPEDDADNTRIDRGGVE